MSEETLTLDTLIARVDAGAEDEPPLDRLTRAIELAARVSELGENLVGHYVDLARRDGVPWSDIGTRLGVSRQATQKRFNVTAALKEPDQPGFWDRTSPELREAVKRARDEAHRRRKTYLGTEHLLLGLVGDEDAIGARALAVCGAPPATVRAAVDGRIGVPSGEPLPDEAPATRLALGSLQHSLREALRSDSALVDTAHLALGLLTIGDGLASDVLTNLGVTYDTLREAADRAR